MTELNPADLPIPDPSLQNALAEASISEKLIRVMKALWISVDDEDASTSSKAWTSQNIGRASELSAIRSFADLNIHQTYPRT